jgi:SAM-dependent methyltransferase
MIAYDLTPQMLEQVMLQANERGITNLTTREGDAASLPFEDASFDVVLSRYSAHHWQRPQAAVHEIVRVLKPNGVFILSDIVAPENPLLDTFLQTIEYLRDNSHVRDYRIAEWSAWFEEAGLQPHIDSEWVLPLEFTPWVKRMATPESHVSIIRKLFAEASAEIQAAFAPTDTHFQIWGALIVGRKG